MTHVNPEMRPKALKVVDALADIVVVGSVHFNLHGFAAEQSIYSPDDSERVYIFNYRVNLLHDLGRGAFGTVYKGYESNNIAFAMKRIITNRHDAVSAAVNFHYMKSVNHTHLVTVHDVKKFRDTFWVVMEYCDLGDLDSFFDNYSKIVKETSVKAKLMKQIISGVSFLHSKGIVHRDVNPSNVLIKRTPGGHAVAKLGDFFLSKFLDPDSSTSAMSSKVGRLRFKPPEFWSYKPGDRVKYHPNMDVYAAGLTFTTMLQARQGRKLVPRAEGSLQSLETKMPIGLSAFTRMDNHYPDISVVEPKATGDKLITKIKEIIRKMTCTCPMERLQASEVEHMLLGTLDQVGILSIPFNAPL